MTGAHLWFNRARWVAEIGAMVVGNPRRLTEVKRWFRERNLTTMDSSRPWWPYEAVANVELRLRPGIAVFEFGGGGSTLWLHHRGALVTCVEHHRGWFEQLRSSLPANVEIVLVEPEQCGSVKSEMEPEGFFDAYINEISRRPDESYDLIIVDGRARTACGLAAIPKVKRGGMLLLDDSNRPRYKPVAEALTTWERAEYAGLKTGGGPICHTTVWTRP